MLIIEEKLHTWSSSDLEGSLDGIIEKLTEKKKELSRTHTDLRVDLETEYGYYDEQWQNLIVYGKRKITVKEFVKGKKSCATIK